MMILILSFLLGFWSPLIIIPPNPHGGGITKSAVDVLPQSGSIHSGGIWRTIRGER